MLNLEKIKRLLAVLAIPLGSAGDWQVLEFKNIKANTVQFMDGAMKIGVEGSAGPIVYKLPEPKWVRGLTVKGHYGPRLKFPTKKQGQPGGDDFALRVGVVIRGDKKLNWLKAKVAPKWITHLYTLAPKGTGIDRIEFINLVEDSSLLGSHRRHPKSELLVERFVAVPDASGEFTLHYSWPASLDVLALWISSDGDDTKAKYGVDLRELSLEVADGPI